VFVLGRLMVSGNAAATAANILGHERLFCSGSYPLSSGACHIAWILLFYYLLSGEPELSLLAAFTGLVVCAMQALTSLLYVALCSSCKR